MASPEVSRWTAAMLEVLYFVLEKSPVDIRQLKGLYNGRCEGICQVDIKHEAGSSNVAKISVFSPRYCNMFSLKKFLKDDFFAVLDGNFQTADEKQLKGFKISTKFCNDLGKSFNKLSFPDDDLDDLNCIKQNKIMLEMNIEISLVSEMLVQIVDEMKIILQQIYLIARQGVTELDCAIGSQRSCTKFSSSFNECSIKLGKFNFHDDARRYILFHDWQTVSKKTEFIRSRKFKIPSAGFNLIIALAKCDIKDTAKTKQPVITFIPFSATGFPFLFTERRELELIQNLLKSFEKHLLGIGMKMQQTCLNEYSRAENLAGTKLIYELAILPTSNFNHTGIDFDNAAIILSMQHAKEENLAASNACWAEKIIRWLLKELFNVRHNKMRRIQVSKKHSLDSVVNFIARSFTEFITNARENPFRIRCLNLVKAETAEDFEKSIIEMTNTYMEKQHGNRSEFQNDVINEDHPSLSDFESLKAQSIDCLPEEKSQPIGSMNDSSTKQLHFSNRSIGRQEENHDRLSENKTSTSISTATSNSGLLRHQIQRRAHCVEHITPTSSITYYKPLNQPKVKRPLIKKKVTFQSEVTGLDSRGKTLTINSMSHVMAMDRNAQKGVGSLSDSSANVSVKKSPSSSIMVKPRNQIRCYSIPSSRYASLSSFGVVLPKFVPATTDNSVTEQKNAEQKNIISNDKKPADPFKQHNQSLDLKACNVYRSVSNATSKGFIPVRNSDLSTDMKSKEKFHKISSSLLSTTSSQLSVATHTKSTGVVLPRFQPMNKICEVTSESPKRSMTSFDGEQGSFKRCKSTSHITATQCTSEAKPAQSSLLKAPSNTPATSVKSQTSLRYTSTEHLSQPNSKNTSTQHSSTNLILQTLHQAPIMHVSGPTPVQPNSTTVKSSTNACNQNKIRSSFTSIMPEQELSSKQICTSNNPKHTTPSHVQAAINMSPEISRLILSTQAPCEEKSTNRLNSKQSNSNLKTIDSKVYLKAFDERNLQCDSNADIAEDITPDTIMKSPVISTHNIYLNASSDFNALCDYVVNGNEEFDKLLHIQEEPFNVDEEISVTPCEDQSAPNVPVKEGTSCKKNIISDHVQSGTEQPSDALQLNTEDSPIRKREIIVIDDDCKSEGISQQNSMRHVNQKSNHNKNVAVSTNNFIEKSGKNTRSLSHGDARGRISTGYEKRSQNFRFTGGVTSAVSSTTKGTMIETAVAGIHNRLIDREFEVSRNGIMVSNNAQCMITHTLPLQNAYTCANEQTMVHPISSRSLSDSQENIFVELDPAMINVDLSQSNTLNMTHNGLFDVKKGCNHMLLQEKNRLANVPFESNSIAIGNSFIDPTMQNKSKLKLYNTAQLRMQNSVYHGDSLNNHNEIVGRDIDWEMLDDIQLTSFQNTSADRQLENDATLESTDDWMMNFINEGIWDDAPVVTQQHQDIRNDTITTPDLSQMPKTFGEAFACIAEYTDRHF